MSLSWSDNPLAAVARKAVVHFPESEFGREAAKALKWAQAEDLEVERVCVRLGEEIREELALDRAAPQLADALEAMLAVALDEVTCYSCHGTAPLDIGGRIMAPVAHHSGCPVPIARAALAKAGRGGAQ